MDIHALIDSLYNGDDKTAYRSLKLLEAESEHSNVTYQYFDVFTEMLNSENSYIRTRGIILISVNAKWDVDFKIDEIIDRLLESIQEAKPITARQCIKSLPKIAMYKPDLKEDILTALRKADITIYTDSMQPLVCKDITTAISKYLKSEGRTVATETILNYIKASEETIQRKFGVYDNICVTKMLVSSKINQIELPRYRKCEDSFKKIIHLAA